MRILLICDEYPPGRHGGIGSVIQLIARTFVSMGHDVTVAGFYHFGYGGQDVFEDEGVKVYRFRQKFASRFFENQDSVLVRGVVKILDWTGLMHWAISKSIKEYGTFLRALIKDHRIQIVEIPDYHDYMRFCKHEVHFPDLNVPIVVKLNGSMTYFNEEAGRPTPAHIKAMEKSLLERAASVVGVSKYTATRTAQYFNYKRHVGILHNGINIPEKPNVVKTKGLVVFTGSLVEKKGIYQLMKAWNIVAAQAPGAQLFIFGKGPVEKIKTYLEENAVPTVFFKGHVNREELYRILASAEVAVFPSYAECFAMAPMEAMACETAVVYSTRTSGPELIENGEDGLLADPDDIKGIADSIILLLKDQKLNDKIAKKGRKRVEEFFDIKIIAKQNIELYKQVLNEANQP